MNDERHLRPRVYFTKGDIVRIKHAIDNRPKMIVETVDKITNPTGEGSGLLGITCYWFDKNCVLHTRRFNTKDLEKANRHD